MRSRVGSTASLVACLLGGGGCLDHHLIHPREPPPSVRRWTEDVRRGALLVHLEAASPPGDGPFPAVLVHPEANHRAAHMRGVLWDLASRGYLAAAADYQRHRGDRDERSLFPWRRPEDATAALDVLLAHPEVDASRVAALGFSQGGVFSLLIAAHSEKVRAVVAYYPVTDFPRWLSPDTCNPTKRLFFKFVRRYFRRQSGARTEEQFRRALELASPLYQADSIRAPVLLVHGEQDRSAPLEESQRLAERLHALGRDVELLAVPGAGHVFNFRDAPRARVAWAATLEWLERHLGSGRLDRLRDDRTGRLRVRQCAAKTVARGVGDLGGTGGGARRGRVSKWGFRSAAGRRRACRRLRSIRGVRRVTRRGGLFRQDTAWPRALRAQAWRPSRSRQRAPP